MLKSLARKNRSTRRFLASPPIDEAVLLDLVDHARVSASGGNVQALKFSLSYTAERNARVFPHLRWAGYLTDWPGPAEDERPSGYIAILWDNDVAVNRPSHDPGIAAQSITLAAVERGLAACMIGSIDRERLSAVLALESRYEILLVIALGPPGEEIRIEELAPGGDHRYWRDAAGVHHVPKRRLADLIVPGPPEPTSDGRPSRP